MELWLLSKLATGGTTGVSTGPGGGADLHGHAVCSGVNSSRPEGEGLGGLHSLAGAVRPYTGKPRGRTEIEDFRDDENLRFSNHLSRGTSRDSRLDRGSSETIHTDSPLKSAMASVVDFFLARGARLTLAIRQLPPSLVALRRTTPRIKRLRGVSLEWIRSVRACCSPVDTRSDRMTPRGARQGNWGTKSSDSTRAAEHPHPPTNRMTRR